MTERLQDYYRYLETKRHQEAQDIEQMRHNREQERLTALGNEETMRANRAKESLQAQANAIAQQANAWTYSVGQQNADTNAKNADTNEFEAKTHSRKADAEVWKAFQDVMVANKNAETNLLKVNYDNANTQRSLNLQSQRQLNDYRVALRNLEQAQNKLDLAWKEYALDARNSTWQMVLNSVNEFNRTADTWTNILGWRAPSKSIRINQRPDGSAGTTTITLKDIAQLNTKLLRR